MLGGSGFAVKVVLFVGVRRFACSPSCFFIRHYFGFGCICVGGGVLLCCYVFGLWHFGLFVRWLIVSYVLLFSVCLTIVWGYV